MTLVERPEDAAAVSALLHGKGIDGLRLIALQPGASTLSRRWAPDRFIALGKSLQHSFPDVALVVTGSPGEAQLCRRVAEGIGGRIWTSAGEAPLKLLPALFRRCSALVTGDTGPMHLAVAVGTPVIALFAVSDYRRSGPAYDLARHVVIQKWRTCDPCLSKRCPYAEPICMENISVDEVFSALTGVMNRSGSVRVGA
jgi:ADP-heptose:LPS heptosyltransferase